MRWIIVILWSIMPCYVALMTNNADTGIIMSVVWTLVSILGFAVINDDEDDLLELAKTWLIIHIIGIMIMVWYFNQP